MGEKRRRERDRKTRKKAKTSVNGGSRRTGPTRDKGGIDLKNCSRKRMNLRLDGDLPIESNPGLETEVELGLPSKSLAETSSNQMLPCCDLEFRQILESKKLITKFRRWPSNSILGRYDEHFGLYPWYRGSTLFSGLTGGDPTLYCSRGVNTFAFSISKVHCDKNIMKATHMINGKEVKIKRTIMVSGIPKRVDEGEFKKFFSQFGNIIEHQVIPDPESIWKSSYGLIIFDSDEAAASLAAKKLVDFDGVWVSISTKSYNNVDYNGWYC